MPTSEPRTSERQGGRRPSRLRQLLRGALLALALAGLLGLGWSRLSVEAQEQPAPAVVEAPVLEAPAPQEEISVAARHGGEIVFQGKLYASLKRTVQVPYKGIVTQLLVQAGQQVKAGDPLLRYTLAPDVIASLRRSLSPRELQDIELRIAQIGAELQPQRVKLKEAEQLARQKMGSDQTVTLVKLEIETLEMQREALKKQLEIIKRSAKDDLVALQDLLGQAVSFESVPKDITVTAPIDGHVLWVHQDLRSGAEVLPAGVMVIGVMDPMIVRANVFEIEASRMKVGDEASFTLSSIPGKTFECTLSRVSWTPVTPGLGQPSYYEIELTAPNPSFILKEGFKTQVSLNADR